MLNVVMTLIMIVIDFVSGPQNFESVGADKLAEP